MKSRALIDLINLPGVTRNLHTVSDLVMATGDNSPAEVTKDILVLILSCNSNIIVKNLLFRVHGLVGNTNK